MRQWEESVQITRSSRAGPGTSAGGGDGPAPEDDDEEDDG
jgi:hypothetical protein